MNSDNQRVVSSHVKRISLTLMTTVIVACTGAGPTTLGSTAVDLPTTGPATSSRPSTTQTSSPTPFLGGNPGRLPDGTPFEIHAEPSMWIGEVTGISAGIMVEGLGPLGIVTFQPGSMAGVEFRDGILRAGSGDWIMRVDVYDAVLTEWGDQAERILVDSVHPQPRRTALPAFDLDPPLRWATNHDLPLHMQVQFEDFVVRRGCDEVAMACSIRRAIQLIPAQEVFAPAPAWYTNIQLWLESSAPRPATDPFYLDPGPLTPRAGHQVVWVGNEMIVWGGSETDSVPRLVDGAAYDPESNEWRTIAQGPFQAGSVTRAVSAGESMIVIGYDQTARYDPAADAWTRVADGFPVPRDNQHVVWTGSVVAAWSRGAMGILDPRDGAWREIAFPPAGGTEPLLGALRSVHGTLVAVGNLRSCNGRYLGFWNGQSWLDLDAKALTTDNLADCSYPRQTGVSGQAIVVWEDEDHPTRKLDFGTGEWADIESIPIPSSEAADGPVPMGDRFLVSQGGVGAIYDRGTWQTGTPPGGGWASDMVWTGKEVLMWGDACCFGTGGNQAFTIDAWRWSPPSH